jgi:hypothetical protein
MDACHKKAGDINKLLLQFEKEIGLVLNVVKELYGD